MHPSHSAFCALLDFYWRFFFEAPAVLCFGVFRSATALFTCFSLHILPDLIQWTSPAVKTRNVFSYWFFSFYKHSLLCEKKKKKKFLTLFSPSLQAVFIWNYSTTAGWNTLEFGSFSPLEVVITAVFILTVLKCCCTGLQLCLTYYNILVQPLKAKISATENSKNPINCEYSFSSPKWK